MLDVKQAALSLTINFGGSKGCMVSYLTKVLTTSEVELVLALAIGHPVRFSTHTNMNRVPVDEASIGPEKSMEKVEKRSGSG